MSVAFSPENEKRLKHIVAKYEQKASALLPALYLAQEQFGYLSKEVLEYVAGKLELPARQAFEAATFYTMFKKKDMGRYCLQVCTNITCTMMGADEIVNVAKEELKIGFREVTSDSVFSLVPVQCLGSCDTAPVAQVNEDFAENLTPDKFRSLIRNLRGGRTQSEALKEVQP